MTEPNGPALDALNGLSVGDALGAQFFVPETARAHHASRTEPSGPWPWTDDTEMACSVYTAQRERGTIDTFDLTHAFALRHDFDRGYGPAANRLLRLVREGGDARALAAELFDGQGSYGNGAAMRVAPLGAAYARDLDEAVRLAARTAVITHTHPQAVDGAIAVAVAAAYAVRARTEPMAPAAFLGAVVEYTPNGVVREALADAVRLLAEPDARAVARLLGNGSRTSAADTVPYALWCAARNLTDYRAAVWEAIAAGGDMDTVAAITGAVVAAHTGTEGIPATWMATREPLPGWAFPEPGSVPPDPEWAADRLKPMLRPRACPVPDLFWTDGQWQLIRSGLRPREMEDRWVSYTSEGVLHLHRSWTGCEVWSIRVARVRGGWRPVSGLAETHRERPRPDPQWLEPVLGVAVGGYGPR
ncbi:ADP-ribosylglycohydrolase family protein [Streptomyces sp. CBMA123]|uniref:ADP-ribosylglycohydrolase family protein n=1 Tax=Streptomyces sp. CBMA123 TaxID=1896313 RepID=UPI00294FF0F8|nr:ADP-ribosylglycohydrolase family protein [Streptomyces sp. CBMA123]